MGTAHCAHYDLWMLETAIATEKQSVHFNYLSCKSVPVAKGSSVGTHGSTSCKSVPWALNPTQIL